MNEELLCDSWTVDSLNEWLHSPMWLVPILSFVDENCLVFNGEKEGFALETTTIHQQYVSLLDSLLEDFKARTGITTTQLLDAIQMGVQDSHAFEAIVMADNFIHFKDMMYLRNLQLEEEAMNQLKKQQSNAQPVAIEPEQLTSITLQSDANKLAIAVRESLVGKSSTQTKPSEEIEREELELAIALSLAREPISLQEEEDSTVTIIQPNNPIKKENEGLSEEELRRQQQELQRIRALLAAKKREEREKLLSQQQQSHSTTSEHNHQQHLCVALATKFKGDISSKHQQKHH